jgi:hypothetical protein
MQLSGIPSGDCATPLSSPQSERSVRMPTSDGDATHWPLEPQASVAPDAERPKLYRVFWEQLSPRTAPRSTYVTHAAPSHVPGDAEAPAAPTIGAAMNPQPSATAAMSLMGLSVDSPSAFASTIGTVGTAGVWSASMKLVVAALLMGLFTVVALAPPANADVVAYLVNVHVRPGYNFPNADAAIGYGNTICDRVAAKMSYAQLVDQVNADFNSGDYYQGAYLINQAVNELCPAQIWQLRQSAAGYTLPA